MGALKTEPRALLDPAIDDVDVLIVFRLRDSAGDAVEDFQPESSVTGVHRTQVDETVKFFSLNVRGLLRRARGKVLQEALDLVNGSTDPANAKVRRLASRFSPHSSCVCTVLTCEGVPLPSVEEEIVWHFSELVKDLRCYEKALERDPTYEEAARHLDEMLYALATLWVDPPSPVTRADVEEWLTDEKLVGDVKGHYDELLGA